MEHIDDMIKYRYYPFLMRWKFFTHSEENEKQRISVFNKEFVRFLADKNQKEIVVGVEIFLSGIIYGHDVLPNKTRMDTSAIQRLYKVGMNRRFKPAASAHSLPVRKQLLCAIANNGNHYFLLTDHIASELAMELSEWV